MGKIREKFDNLKKENKKAFIPFITFGYPDIKTFSKLVIELDKAGADFIEIGLPFSDPIADGPVIQESSHIALEKGANIYELFKTLKELRPKVKAEFIIMSYLNPVYSMGIKKFFSQAKDCIAGVIISDLLIDEADFFIKEARKNEIDTIFFVSPLSNKKRIKMVDKLSTGFIYYISVTGVTGPRTEFSKDMFSHIKKVKASVSCPLCVGFGISSQEQARKVKVCSDGIIIGSAIIKKIAQIQKKKSFFKEFKDYLRWLNG